MFYLASIENMKSKQKRVRRTNAEVENAISSAMDRLVEKYGLLKITANMLMEEAAIESPVFFNRYDSIDDLIYEYISGKDFWIKETLPFKDIDKVGPEEYYIQTLLKLFETLKTSKAARDVLVWELMSESDASCKIARLKEMENESLLVYYSRMFQNSGINIRGITSLLIAGIYYLCLHKDKSTFCGLDINEKGDNEAFEKLIKDIVGAVFADVGHCYVDARTAETARRMAGKGIDVKTISEILDIKEEDVEYILSKNGRES